MDWIADPSIWAALATLTMIEIVLGIDNLIFIAIIAGKLPEHQQKKARALGLALALVARIVLLFSLTLIMKLTAPLFSVLGNGISGRDIILILGGLFLLGKSTLEIHEKLEGEEEGQDIKVHTFKGVIIQIVLLDLVFSLDSVITAIGLADQIAVMIAAVVIAMAVMLFTMDMVSTFVERHPTVKMLALSFLLLIGMTLVGEGLDMHIPKGYVYFAMAFSVFVEILNLRVRAKRKAGNPVVLRKKIKE